MQTRRLVHFLKVQMIEKYSLLFLCILNIFDWRLGILAGCSLLFIAGTSGYGAGLPYAFAIGACATRLLSMGEMAGGGIETGAGAAAGGWTFPKSAIFGGGLNASSSGASASVLIHFLFSGSHTIYEKNNN